MFDRIPRDAVARTARVTGVKTAVERIRPEPKDAAAVSTYSEPVGYAGSESIARILLKPIELSLHVVLLSF